MADITPQIRQALETHLQDSFPTLDISWENIRFDPDQSEKYLESYFVPVARDPAVKGQFKQKKYTGYLLIYSHTKLNLGSGEGDVQASNILEAFEVTSDISLNGYNIHIRYAEREMGYPEGPHWRIPVRIGWQIYN